MSSIDDKERKFRVGDTEAGLYNIDGPDGYLDADEVVTLLNAATSATRESVIEEAASICEQMRPIITTDSGYTPIAQRQTLDNAARLIRALKQTQYVRVLPDIEGANATHNDEPPCSERG